VTTDEGLKTYLASVLRQLAGETPAVRDVHAFGRVPHPASGGRAEHLTACRRPLRVAALDYL